MIICCHEGIGLPNLGVGFQLVPSSYETDYTSSGHDAYGDSRPPVLDFIRDTGDKASTLLRNVGDKTRWLMDTKVKAIRNIFPKVPSGYSVPNSYGSSSSSSYGVPFVSYGPGKQTPQLNPDPNSTPFGNIATATVKSAYDSDTVYVYYFYLNR